MLPPRAVAAGDGDREGAVAPGPQPQRCRRAAHRRRQPLIPVARIAGPAPRDLNRVHGIRRRRR
jgi:hypothetical protein